MPLVYGCISAYNEEWNISKAVGSLRGKVDRIVLVDGAYEGFEMRHPRGLACSRDCTVQCAVESGADFIILPGRYKWCDEIQKRNAYLIAQPGDYYFVLDSDEEYLGPPVSVDLLSEGRVWDVPFKRTDMDEYIPLFRIFRHEHGLCYRETHHAVWVGNELLNKQKHELLVGGLVLHHIGSHGSEYLEARGRYHHVLKEKESEARGRFGL